MAKKIDSFGDRMKNNYENVTRTYLTRRVPVIIRLDGCHFHTFLKHFSKPFDSIMVETMREVTLELCKRIQGCVLGYTQSDEITLVLVDYHRINSEAWYDYNTLKMCSVSASLTTMLFNKILREKVGNFIVDNAKSEDEATIKRIKAYRTAVKNGATFDSRCFNIPREEVINCVLWRIKDCIKNSISSFALSKFSHKELIDKSTKERKKIALDKGYDWEALDGKLKSGTCVVKTEDGWNITNGSPSTYAELSELFGKQLKEYDEED